MALGIKGLPAAALDEIDGGMLFEGVAENVDASGKLYARKVRAEQLAMYLAGALSPEESTAVTQMADEKISGALEAHDAEEAAHSAAFTAHNGDAGAHDDIRLAVIDETDRAFEAEFHLEAALLGKASKLTAGAKRLSDAETGDQIGLVHFRTEETPAPLGADGELALANGKFEFTGGVFEYTKNGQTPVIIWNGAWQRAVIDAGGAGVTGEVNAEGGVGDLSLFGLADLSDVRTELLAKHGEQHERLNAHDTLINSAGTKNGEQDGRLDALETGLALIPAVPGTDGEYKLVISGGAASWEII
jgi:hypothetical protein